jgi:cytochrome P450
MSGQSPGTPAHVRAAPTHPDPYPYYDELPGRGLFWDEDQGVWVAASAEAVAAVFDSSQCLTRPLEQPVPKAMQGTSVAEIFARLVRMRDGPGHALLKRALSEAVQSLDGGHIESIARTQAERLIDELKPQQDGARLTQFLSALSSRSVATLLGVPPAQLQDLERWIGEYGAAAAAAVTGAPPVTDPLMATGAAASRAIYELFSTLVEAEADTLSTRFARAARSAGVTDRADVVANAAGVLIQGQGAIAALMGLMLLRLSTQPALRAEISSKTEMLAAVTQEVLRCDPGTQSTLRFMAGDGAVAGQQMRAGDCIIVSIAAANRDPALNSEPMRFKACRPARLHFEFGRGAHACPGQAMALTIAQTGITALLAAGLPREGLERTVSYRPSFHIRIPAFAPGG